VKISQLPTLEKTSIPLYSPNKVGPRVCKTVVNDDADSFSDRNPVCYDLGRKKKLTEYLLSFSFC
jgi:hypothetical protein